MSEATALAIHAMAFLAMNRDQTINAAHLAQACHASEAHMVKVCQRLAKAGFVTPRRGPGGGFRIERDPEEIRLFEIYAVFDGDLKVNHCMFATGSCRQGNMHQCILGSKMAEINREITRYFQETRLSDIAANCHARQIVDEPVKPAKPRGRE